MVRGQGIFVPGDIHDERGNLLRGEKLPDLAFVQLAVRDVPALTFFAEPNAIRIGIDVAYAGFPFGSDGLVLRIDDQPPMVVQATPFLRHGVVSSHSSQGQTAIAC